MLIDNEHLPLWDRIKIAYNYVRTGKLPGYDGAVIANIDVEGKNGAKVVMTDDPDHEGVEGPHVMMVTRSPESPPVVLIHNSNLKIDLGSFGKNRKLGEFYTAIDFGRNILGDDFKLPPPTLYYSNKYGKKDFNDG